MADGAREVTDSEMRILVELCLANDEIRQVLSRAIDSLNELMKDVSLEDLQRMAERERQQIVAYAVYFAPKRSNN